MEQAESARHFTLALAGRIRLCRRSALASSTGVAQRSRYYEHRTYSREHAGGVQWLDA